MEVSAGTRLLASAALLFVSAVLPLAQGTDNGTRKCGPFIRTIGYTFPHGDISLLEGSPLEVLCVLPSLSFENRYHNSSDLRLYIGNASVAPEHVSIVNETTVRVYVPRMPVTETMFYCRLKIRQSEKAPPRKEEGVCLNNVVVGYEPLDVDDFKCISYNWRSVNCTWVPKYNPVRTTYRIFFQTRNHDPSAYKCPTKTDEQFNKCDWSDGSNPMYRQVASFYKFILAGENALKNKTYIHEWDHFKHILPAGVTNLEATNATTSSFLLKWTVPFPMSTWARSYMKLVHRVAYAFKGGKETAGRTDPFVTAFEGTADCPSRGFDQTHEYQCYYNLTGLQYAHYLYDIRVFIKTENASDEFWSPPAFTVKRTAPAVPPRPPRTDVGSFEVAYHIPSKDVTLYWQTLPEALHSGANFTYKIVEVLKNNEPVESMKLDTIGKKKLVVFRNLTLDDEYSFRVASSNEMGTCADTSVIIVPPSKYSLLEPESFTKTSMGNGDFKLTWNGPRKSSEEIRSYTIFWCDSFNDRPETCSGFLNWTHVDKDARELTVQLKPMMYHFAIAANTERASSGMVWASCSMSKNKVDKLKTVVVAQNDDATSLIVNWKLHCTDANNIVKGFIVFYCVAFGDCKEKEQNMTISGDHTLETATLQGLQPYATYRIAVAIKTEGGYSLPSDPIYMTTKEAAPSTPPIDVTVADVTNSSVRVFWSPSANPNGVIRNYEIIYNGVTKKHFIDSSKQSEKVIEDTIEGLASYTNYSIQVKACTGACSEPSAPVAVQTMIGRPGRVSNTSAQYVNYSQVLLKWDRPSVQGGRIDHYIVTMNVRRENDSRDKPKEFSVVGTGGGSEQLLVPIPNCEQVRNVVITFSIRAMNLDGDKEFLGDAVEVPAGTCVQGPERLNVILISLSGVVAVVLVVAAVIYSSRKILRSCREMRDLAVKLPPGMLRESDAKESEFTKPSWITRHPNNDDAASNTRPAAEADKERLLQGKDDRNGESSGRGSSGPDTVSTSTNSGTHISSDSGTAMDQNEQSGPGSGKWAASATTSVEPRGQLESEWTSPPYVHVGHPVNPVNPVGADGADQTTALYPNIEPANWLQPSEGYVTMTGKEGTFIPQVHSAMAATSPTKPPRGYVAHNAPVAAPNVELWNKPLLSDGYVQTGFKIPDVTEGDAVADSECAEVEEEEQQPIVKSRPSSGSLLSPSVVGLSPSVVGLSPSVVGLSPSVVGLASKVLRGDECERTSVEMPLVATRTPNGYVAHSPHGAVAPQAKAPPTLRHEYVRTAENNSAASSMLDAGKPYTRLGERDPATCRGGTLAEVLGKPMAPAVSAMPSAPARTPTAAVTSS